MHTKTKNQNIDHLLLLNFLCISQLQETLRVFHAMILVYLRQQYGPGGLAGAHSELRIVYKSPVQ